VLEKVVNSGKVRRLTDLVVFGSGDNKCQNGGEIHQSASLAGIEKAD
jgi:hypothetical protein